MKRRNRSNAVMTWTVLAGWLLLLPVTISAEPLALVGATVYTVSGPVLPGATVLIEEGRIVAVGADVTVPDTVRRVDLSGRRLYPGLINANTVLGLVEIGSISATRDYAEFGELNPNDRAEVAINPSSELIPVTRAGGVLMALTAIQGGLISGTSALIYTSGWTWEEMTMQAPTGLMINWPGMRINRSHRARTSPEEQIKARELRIERLCESCANARSYWQARQASGVQPPEQDVKWDAMRAVIQGEIPVMVRANDTMQILAALDWAEDEGARMILVGGGDSWRVAAELVERQVPVILRRTTSMPMRGHEPYDVAYSTAARLYEAGVQFAFSTGGASNARNLSFEAGVAVAYGLPPEAALRAMTLAPAEIFGVADRVGSIEVGKEATLIATDGDVLDFRSHVTAAWIAGDEVDLNNRHRRLYETYRARPKPEN